MERVIPTLGVPYRFSHRVPFMNAKAHEVDYLSRRSIIIILSKGSWKTCLIRLSAFHYQALKSDPVNSQRIRLSGTDIIDLFPETTADRRLKPDKGLANR